MTRRPDGLVSLNTTDYPGVNSYKYWKIKEDVASFVGSALKTLVPEETLQWIIITPLEKSEGYYVSIATTTSLDVSSKTTKRKRTGRGSTSAEKQTTERSPDA